MANKINRNLFTRKRLISDLNAQVEIINEFSAETTQATILTRKEALEDLRADFKANTEAIENTRDWVGTDEFITENTTMHDAFVNSLVKILTVMPDENE